MQFVHLTASTFFGGPERQMLGLADALPADCRTTIASFAEGGRCDAFLAEVSAAGHRAVRLANDTPRMFAAVWDVAEMVRGADLLLCHGYKANMVGRVAARRVGVPAVAVSRGWTGEDWKVRAYEWLDRRHLPLMDRVVCVSEGQAVKVRRTGVAAARLTVIRNAARLDAFADPDPARRRELFRLFPGDVRRVVVGAGRLSPEKGFDVLAVAAHSILARDPAAGIVIFGDGGERGRIERLVAGLGPRFVLAGFRPDLDRLLPWADVLALPSHTEGLPNVVLEAAAAGVPVVATAVGGTPEAVIDGETGYLVPPADPDTLAVRITTLLTDDAGRRRMGAAAREFVRERFSFAAQAEAYLDLAHELAGLPVAAC